MAATTSGDGLKVLFDFFARFPEIPIHERTRRVIAEGPTLLTGAEKAAKERPAQLKNCCDCIDVFEPNYELLADPNTPHHLKPDVYAMDLEIAEIEAFVNGYTTLAEMERCFIDFIHAVHVSRATLAVHGNPTVLARDVTAAMDLAARALTTITPAKASVEALEKELNTKAERLYRRMQEMASKKTV